MSKYGKRQQTTEVFTRIETRRRQKEIRWGGQSPIERSLSKVSLGLHSSLVITDSCTAFRAWSDIFECYFKAQGSKLERLISHVSAKKDVRALSFEL